jgi:hypothetical protein
VKLISHFSTIIPNKMSTTKLFFSITQLKGKSTKAYLKRFNKKMLSFGNLLELINIQALINEIYNYLYENLYIFHDKTLINMKQVMKNHIQVEKVSVTKHDHHRFQMVESP